jgi:CheY-like chemotaxis protein
MREGKVNTRAKSSSRKTKFRSVWCSQMPSGCKGFQVIEAAYAEDAIKALNFNPDVALVVCDMRMRSAEDGMVIARYVRAHHAGVTLVLAVAHAPPLNDDLFDCFFPKPYDPTASSGRSSATSSHVV